MIAIFAKLAGGAAFAAFCFALGFCSGYGRAFYDQRRKPQGKGNP